MIVVLSVMNGLNRSIHQRLLSVDPHLLVSTNDLSSAQDLASQLRTEHAVFQQARLRPVVEEDLIFRTIDALFSGAIARGLSDESLAELGEQIFIGGLDPSQALKLKAGEIMVGEDLARSLAIFENDEITVIQPESLLLPPDEVPPYEKLKVSYIFRSNLADLDGKYIFYRSGSSLRRFPESRSRKFALQIYLADKDQLDHAHQLLLQQGLQVRSWQEKNSSYLYALKLEKIAMASFLGLTVLIASFTIVMVLSLLMSQKRQDIALMQTLGLSQAQTQKLFTHMGFQLGAFGVVGGWTLGIGLCLLLSHFQLIELPSDIYYDHKLPVVIDYPLSIAIVISGLILCYLGAYFPARSGSKIGLGQMLRPGGEI